MRQLISLGVPGVIAGGITQLNLVISTIIASWLPSAPAWLYYADRVYQFPLGMVGVAIGIVLLPDLSRKLRADDHAGVHESQNRSLEFALFLTLPAAVALMTMPFAIVQVMFERGAFHFSDTTATASALAAFAAGLPAFVMIKVFSPGFFAREDTKTPMIYAGIAVGINIIGALALFSWLGHVGIAIATTISAWVNAGLLGFTLHRRGYFYLDKRLQRNLPRILAASLIMGAVVFLVNYQLVEFFTLQTPFLMRLLLLMVIIFAGVVVYFGMSFALGNMNIRDLRKAIKR